MTMIDLSKEDFATLIDNTHKFANSIAPIANGITTLASWADSIDPDEAETKSARRRAVAQKSAYLGTMYNLMTVMEHSATGMADAWKKVFTPDTEEDEDDSV